MSKELPAVPHNTDLANCQPANKTTHTHTHAGETDVKKDSTNRNATYQQQQKIPIHYTL